MNLPSELMKNPHFSRYYRTWENNELSIVFVPLAQICLERGLLPEAREICEKGLAHHPHLVSGRLLLAQICYGQEQVDDARRLVEEILQELPSQREAISLLEKIKRSNPTEPGEPPETTDPQEEKVPERPSLWENVTMAKIYADQGEVPTALRILDRILTRDPHNERALALREEWKSWRS